MSKKDLVQKLAELETLDLRQIWHIKSKQLVKLLSLCPNVTTLIGHAKMHKEDLWAISKSLPNLQQLDLRSSGFWLGDLDFLALSALTQLQVLRINSLGDGAALSTLINLKELEFNARSLHDFSFLKKLTKLEKLVIRDHMSADLSALNELVHLRSLTFDGFGWNLASLNFSQITHLETLVVVVDTPNYSSLQPLACLTNLKKLHLNVAAIPDLSLLDKFPKLQDLELHSVKARNLPSLPPLTNITKLTLEYTPYNYPPQLPSLEPFVIESPRIDFKRL